MDLAVDAEQCAETGSRVVDAVSQTIQGKAPVIRQCLAAVLAGGHVLLEDVPGVGKTELAAALAATLGLRSRRIQFTADLLPSDITGVSIFHPDERQFVFHPGPIFTNVVVADELNRTPPKTQSALLEAMSEAAVSVDGTTHPLPAPFTVIATENPVESAGTFVLPEAQRDRFMVRLRLGYPDARAEARMLAAHNGGARQTAAPVLALEQTLALRDRVALVHVSDDVCGFLVGILDATRHDPALALGASPRAGVQLQQLARAWALLEGREFVLPDDVAALAPVALSHRVIPVAHVRDPDPRVMEDAIARIVAQVPVPGVA